MRIYATQVILPLIAMLTGVIRISGKSSIQKSGRIVVCLTDYPADFNYRLMLDILSENKD